MKNIKYQQYANYVFFPSTSFNRSAWEYAPRFFIEIAIEEWIKQPRFFSSLNIILMDSYDYD